MAPESDSREPMRGFSHGGWNMKWILANMEWLLGGAVMVVLTVVGWLMNRRFFRGERDTGTHSARIKAAYKQNGATPPKR
jgi:hypothetical protein